jgi:hypothetical protein
MWTAEYARKLAELLEPIHSGEHELKTYLRQHGRKVEDVSDNPDYWKKDIDLIVDDMHTVEVKWDSKLYDTGNLFIETLSDTNTKAKGWYKFCEADTLAYGDAQNKYFYLFDFAALKEHIEAHKDDYKTVVAADYGKDGIKKYSEGYLVPLDTLSGLYDTLDLWGY